MHDMGFVWAAAHLEEHDVVVPTQRANEPSVRLAARLGCGEADRFEKIDVVQWIDRSGLVVLG